jgi:hypothetical protein
MFPNGLQFVFEYNLKKATTEYQRLIASDRGSASAAAIKTRNAEHFSDSIYELDDTERDFT